MLHHKRLPFLLVSRKSQPQSPTPGHSLTRLTLAEVRSSTAEDAMGHNIQSNASSRFNHSQAKPSAVGTREACSIASANAACKASRSAFSGDVACATAKKIRYIVSRNMIARSKILLASMER